MQARVQLMLGEPYLASAIARLPVVNADGLGWCDTMATDGYYIYVNPAFCATLTPKEIVFVFAHEVMHCVLGHIDRRQDRQHALWNEAIDYATNLMLVQLGMQMPKIGLMDQNYLGMTAEDIYAELKKESESSKKKNNSLSAVAVCSGGGGDEEGNENSEQTPKGWDLHIAPDDMRGQNIRAREFPSSEERKRLRIALGKPVEEKLRGTMRGLMEGEFKKAGGGEVPWRTLLSRFFTGLRRDNYRLMPPNKKHIWNGLYLPSIGSPGPSHIVVAIDTSGSMSDRELGLILGELDKLRSATECRLTLIQCDADIQKVEEFDECSATSFERMRIYGRGGTRFEPVFDWIKEKSRQGVFTFDTLIYLTDGFGSFPDKPPSYPVLWIMVPHCIQQVPFGEVIKLENLNCKSTRN
jgi:predicted metal-dependent peptidase